MDKSNHHAANSIFKGIKSTLTDISKKLDEKDKIKDLKVEIQKANLELINL